MKKITTVIIPILIYLNVSNITFANNINYLSVKDKNVILHTANSTKQLTYNGTTENYCDVENVWSSRSLYNYSIVSNTNEYWIFSLWWWVTCNLAAYENVFIYNFKTKKTINLFKKYHDVFYNKDSWSSIDSKSIKIENWGIYYVGYYTITKTCPNNDEFICTTWQSHALLTSKIIKKYWIKILDQATKTKIGTFKLNIL